MTDASEIVERALREAASIRSLRHQERHLRTSGSNRQEGESTHILVGEDTYSAIKSVSSHVTMTFEILFFHGKFYRRADPSRLWEPPDSQASFTSMVADPTAEVAPDAAAIRIYRLPVHSLSGHRWRETPAPGPTEHVVHVTTRMSQGNPLPGSPDDVPAVFPDRIEGTAELWIDVETAHIIRSLVAQDYLRDGNSVGGLTQESEYSDFNSAVLPGPLPAA